MSADATAVPINATIQPATAPISIPQGAKTAGERTADVIAAARALPREMTTEDVAKLTGDPAAEKPATPAPAQPQTDATKQAPPEEPKDSPTTRIAQLSRRNREEKAAREAAEARTKDAEARAEAAEAKAKTFGEIKEAFAKDPLTAIERMSEGLPLGEAKSAWQALVSRIASGGQPPTPEQVAAAEKIAQEQARDERLKKLEEARAADEKATKDAEAEQIKATEAEQQTGAVNYVVAKLISAEKHPNLVGIGERAAAEAIDLVNEACKAAFEQKKRPSPHPIDFAESERLVSLTLDDLQKIYADLHQQLSPKSPSQAGGTAAPAPQTTATPATPANPAVKTEVATSQQVGPRTITNAVGGDSPPAAQPTRKTADEARIEAIAAARRLPPL